MREDRSTWDDEFDELLADAVSEPPLLIPGTELAAGRFVVCSLLGTGGMGAVYRATDTRRNLDIAIKVLSRVEPTGIYSLKREFRSLSSVDHPSLVSLHELYSDRGTWFFTMDLVAGRPLSQVRWTRPLLRDVFAQIAEAIQAIHQQGMLHRDLKPSNVMLTPGGRIVVLDFGLVSDQAPGGPGLTLADDGVSGTPAYMAPEQATGPASPQSDWYAFGTMLYEALFGRPPFEEGGMAALVRKREHPASRPPDSARAATKDLEDLCLRLLERDAAIRPGYQAITAILGTPATADPLPDDPAQPPFVGRGSELDALNEAFLDTDRGCCAIVTVSGGPGIGKTRLIKHFLEMVREELDGVVLCGRCPQWEHVPYRACDSLIDDLSRYLRTLPTERAATMLPRTTPALTQIFPVLDRLPAVRTIKLRHALPREPAELRRLGLAALRDLVGNIAAQERLVVFVDDLQWSDVDGARLLASLVTPITKADAPAMLLVVAHRQQDAGGGPGLTAFLDRVTANPDLQVRSLRLRQLDATESRQLAVQLLEGPGSETAKRIAHQAGGNPLLIGQMVDHIVESGADADAVDLDGVFAKRIAALAPPERQTLAAICLTGHPVSVGLIAQVTGQSDPELPVRNLVSAHLARFASHPTDAVAAFHDRIRDVVLSMMTDSERQSLHGRFVEALEKTSAPDLVALTLHYRGCGRRREAAACAVRAAQSAASVLAFPQAAAMYGLALQLGRWERPERIDLLVHLAETLVLDRRSGDAGARFLQAASLEADPARCRALKLRAADRYMAGGWLGKGIELLRVILREVDLDYDEICGANLIVLRKQLAKRGPSITPRPPSEIEPDKIARLEALQIAGNGLAWLRPQSVHFRFRLALEALDAGDPLGFACGLKTIARFDTQFDPDDDEIYRVVCRICEDNPGTHADLIQPGLETGMAFVRGRPWDQYDAACRTEQFLLQHPTQDARVLDVARYHQALALYLQGDCHRLQHCWSWLEDAEDRNDLFLGSWLNVLLATQCLSQDRPAAAREMCHRAVQLWEEDDLRGTTVGLAWSGVLSTCDSYDRGGSAWEQICAGTEWFDRSPFYVLPFLACYRHCASASAALATVQLEGPAEPRRDELLRQAEDDIAKAARARAPSGKTFVLPHYRNVATLLSAGLAALRGDTESALVRLDRGLEQMSAAGSYSLRSAHARRAKGLLLGGSEGEVLVEQAETDLQSLGVADPTRHARTVLPGFPE